MRQDRALHRIHFIDGAAKVRRQMVIEFMLMQRTSRTSGGSIQRPRP